MGDLNINLPMIQWRSQFHWLSGLNLFLLINTMHKSPTRLTSQSKTLIDNIFSTDTANEVIAGNI